MADKRSNQGNMSVNEAGQKGGKQSSGNFANDPQRASEAGQKGGQIGGQQSSGNFANDRQKASEAGQKGGKNSNSRS